MLSPYATVVEKLHRDVNKERVTMLKVERAGDVLVDAVSKKKIYFLNALLLLYSIFCYSFPSFNGRSLCYSLLSIFHFIQNV